MAKKTFYFSHDHNPLEDERLGAMVHVYKAAGYGLFWRIVEILHSDETHTFTLNNFNFSKIAREFGIINPRTNTPDHEFIAQFIYECITVYELFQINGTTMWSNRVNKNVNHQSTVRAKRVESGKAGGKARVATLAQKTAAPPLLPQNTSNDLTPSSVTSSTIPTNQAIASNSQANASNSQANASNGQAIATFFQANPSKVFPLKNRIEDSLSSLQEKKVRGCGGKNEINEIESSGLSNFLNKGEVHNGNGNTNAGAGSTVDYLRNARKQSTAHRSEIGNGNGEGNMPLSSDTGIFAGD